MAANPEGRPRRALMSRSASGISVAGAMGLASATDIPDAIRDMNARLGLPAGLAAMGVETQSFEKIIKGALADHCHLSNPRLASIADYETMLEKSM